ncbi:YbjN domain-containing protein [Roseobacter sp. HKCCA0434]|uniref:YbjN domain-containing protein n=1 Tax=Roseobacter sp. HKCCA0434 TaxID=3079297 RepID=UPI002905D1EC|nr:YbjN domain-containing protein [Roseobacter sp. HKCCA0434]
MRTATLSIPLATAILSAASLPSFAQGTIYDENSLDAIYETLQRENESLQLFQTEEGGFFLEGTYRDTAYFLDFLACSQPHICSTLHFTMPMPADPEVTGDDLNAFHVADVWGRLVVYEDETMSLEMPVNIEGGVTEANLIASHALFLQLMDALLDG